MSILYKPNDTQMQTAELLDRLANEILSESTNINDLTHYGVDILGAACRYILWGNVARLGHKSTVTRWEKVVAERNEE